MISIWNLQKKHVKCIQDPPGVPLYRTTGERTMGGIKLPIYSCARGSSSLESFHLHLNRFIPGDRANSLNFQNYLLDGLHRWNMDRLQSSEKSEVCSYDKNLLQNVNQQYEQLFGEKVVPQLTEPFPYTGEPIGIDYHYKQIVKAIPRVQPDLQETEELLEDVKIEDTEDDVNIQNDPHWEDYEESSFAAPGPSSV